MEVRGEHFLEITSFIRTPLCPPCLHIIAHVPRDVRQPGNVGEPGLQERGVPSPKVRVNVPCGGLITGDMANTLLWTRDQSQLAFLSLLVFYGRRHRGPTAGPCSGPQGWLAAEPELGSHLRALSCRPLVTGSEDCRTTRVS